MKKIMLLLILFLTPVLVMAENNVEITKVEKVDQSDDIIINSEPTFEGIKINFDIKFTKLNDFVKYKLTIKNNVDTDYEVDTGSTFAEGEYIEYAFSFDENEDNILKANDTKIVYLTIKYNKKVPPEKYVDGAYIENNTMAINLSTDGAVNFAVAPQEKNPNTGTKDILITLAVLSVIGLLLLIALKKNNFAILPIIILLIPVTIYALEKITIEVVAKIEIENIYRENSISVCLISELTDDPSIESRYNIIYEDGMTWETYLESDYSNPLPEVYKQFLREKLINQTNAINGSFYFYSTEFNNCMSEHEIVECGDYFHELVSKEQTLKSKDAGTYAISNCK